MSPEAARYKEIQCSVCRRSFDTMSEFKGHTDKDGQHCIGGTPQ